MTQRWRVGQIVNLPRGVDAKIIHVDGGVLHGRALWPGHPDPVPFWTTTSAWEQLVVGEVPTTIHTPRLVPDAEAL